MKESIIQEKSYKFAIRIVKLYVHLKETRGETTLSKQILRCGTSIGANVEEASGAQSRRDFSHKISISYKEAKETRYWLRLLNDTGFIDKKMFDSLLYDCEELLKIMGSIQITLKNKEK
jgi:four helix bundle protein